MKDLKKPFVVRITGLETNDRLEAEQIVRTTILAEKEPSDEEVSNITVVPSCNDPDAWEALVDFEAGQLPPFLAGLESDPLESISLPQTNADDLTFDCHFHGFTQLYPTSDERHITADIIAITGLDGHAYGSWQAKKQPWRMWLRHFLAKDLPNCRTMIYGYDSKLNQNGFANIKQYCDEFLEQARLIRQPKEVQQRPVIFIAHSFGGILLARALVKAQQRENDPALADLFRATHGIAFFGVPHYGMVVDDMMDSLGSDHSRQQLLQQISTGEHALAPELDHFVSIIEGRRIKSFVEGKESRNLVQDAKSQRWQRTGDPVTRLSYDNAILRLPDWIEQRYTIHEDHLNMVKLPKKQGPYKVVLHFLKKCEEEASGVVKRRFDPRPPKRVSNMPFGRDKAFVGRESILRRIDLILKDVNRAGVFGLSGIGKSQIAIEYAHRYRIRNPHCHLLWVYAGTRERFVESFWEIAMACEVPGYNDTEANVLDIVFRWLRRENNGTWLLILDNVDDKDVLLSEHALETGRSTRLIDYLPDVGHGKILVTSRSESTAFSIVQYPDNLCEVDVMDDEECHSLVKNRLRNKQASLQDIKSLCDRLDRIPLAITQACAYLNENRLSSISSYIRLISTDTNALLRRPWDDLRRDRSVPNAVIDSFAPSFAYLREHYHLASILLSIMAQFDRQNIPKYLVAALTELGDEPNSTFTDQELDESLSRLLDFSLIKVEEDKSLFDLHSLVQTSITLWERSRGTLDEVQERALRMMAIVAPDEDFKNWKKWKALSPHVTAVLDHNQDSHSDTMADLLYLSSRFLREAGDYKTSEVRGDLCLKIRQEIYSRDDTRMLDSMTNLASTYVCQGRWLEAEKLEVQVMETKIRVLGGEHPETLSSMHNLASIYNNQGRWSEAEKIQLQVMETSLRVLEGEHPLTLTSMANLAATYNNQGRWSEAEKIQMQVMETSLRVLGEEHPDTLTSMANLAATYSNQGRWPEAKKNQMQVMETNSRVLGGEHPLTLLSMANLASTFSASGDLREAEELQIKVLKMRDSVLGTEHPDTLSAMSKLAMTYRDQGRLMESRLLQTQALEMRERILGRFHPMTRQNVADLALIYRQLGMHKEALELEMQLFELSSLSATVEPVANAGDADSSDAGSDISDVSSMFSTTHSEMPSDSSRSSTQDINIIAGEQFAAELLKEDDLKSLYEAALEKFGDGRFAKNHDRLLKELLKAIRSEATTIHQMQAIRILRVKRSRNIVTNEITRLLRPADAETRQAMIDYQNSKADRQYAINRLLQRVGPAESSRKIEGEKVTDLAGSISINGDKEGQNESDEDSGDDTDEDSDDDDNDEPNDLSQPLDAVAYFVIKAKSFAHFKDRLRILIHPPRTLQEALDTRQPKEVEKLLEKQFQQVANGDYLWLWDLQESGYSKRDIAELLLEAEIYAPWIPIEPKIRQSCSLQRGMHLLQCVHQAQVEKSNLDLKISKIPADELFQRQEEARSIVQELVGFGGIIPESNSNDWGGKVDFSDGNTRSSILYHHPVRSGRPFLVSHIVRSLEAFCSAFGHLQEARLACDSFTMLLSPVLVSNCGLKPQTSQVELSRVDTELVLQLRESLDDLKAPQEITAEATSRCGNFAKALLMSLFRDKRYGELEIEESIDLSLHLCSLAVQLICLGLISYIQAHVGEILPFFLDTPQRTIILKGSQDDSIQILAEMSHLTCFGHMLKGQPVLTFSCNMKSAALFPYVGPDCYDLLGSPEDILDTWGPGNLVYSNDNPTMPCAILVGGGVIYAIDETCKVFHWSPKVELVNGNKWLDRCDNRDEKVNDTNKSVPIVSFDSKEKIVVGSPNIVIQDASIKVTQELSASVGPRMPIAIAQESLVTVNETCCLDEHSCWKNLHHAMQDLGPFEPYWQVSERQRGIQAGQYAVLAFNLTQSRVNGKTLKQQCLENEDCHLASYLECRWGLQISICTGVARRVLLRELVADLIPFFARIYIGENIWNGLQSNVQIADKLRNHPLQVLLSHLQLDEQKTVLDLVRFVLRSLKDTGVDQAGNLIVAWPQQYGIHQGFKIPCVNQTKWARILEDSRDCATFAYFSTICLESCRINCSGKLPTSSDICSTMLGTAVLPPMPTLNAGIWVLNHGENYFIKTVESVVNLNVHIQQISGRSAPCTCLIAKDGFINTAASMKNRIFNRQRHSEVRRLRERRNDIQRSVEVLILHRD